MTEQINTAAEAAKTLAANLRDKAKLRLVSLALNFMLSAKAILITTATIAALLIFALAGGANTSKNEDPKAINAGMLDRWSYNSDKSPVIETKNRWGFGENKVYKHTSKGTLELKKGSNGAYWQPTHQR